MKKKGLIIGIACICLVLLIGLYFLFGNRGETITDFRFTEDIVVENGVADIAESEIPFTVEEDGTYVMHTTWNAKEAGMISGLAVYNPAGEIVFCVTGESVEADSVEVELEAGEYIAHYYYLTNEDDLDALVQDSNAVGYSDEEPYTYATNGTYEMTYQFSIQKTDGMNIWLCLGVLAGIVIGAILIIVVLILTKTDGNIEPKYDERQLLERGKGFKLAFFVEMIYTAFLILMYIMEIKVPVATEVLLFFGIVLSVFVYAVYCIRKEAYISLNESVKKLNVAFLLIGIANLLIGVSHCFSGGMIQDGVLTFRSLNLICGIFMMIMSIVIGTSQIESKEEEE
ncbi:MAG: hypothetical protein J6K43_07415 [Lachnospiraceae bacterium]|nr:hypothetical protein [Lachnospiraceae bacterium]